MPLEPSCSCAIENSSGVENARKANCGRLFAHASNLKVQPPFSRAAFSLHFAPAPLPPFQRDVRKGLQFRRQRRWLAHSRAHKGLSALAYSLRTKYTAATSILRTAHDLLPIGFVAQSDRMLVELIQRSGLQSKPGSKTFSSIPGLSYFPFLNHWWSFSLFSSQ